MIAGSLLALLPTNAYADRIQVLYRIILARPEHGEALHRQLEWGCVGMNGLGDQAESCSRAGAVLSRDGGLWGSREGSGQHKVKAGCEGLSAAQGALPVQAAWGGAECMLGAAGPAAGHRLGRQLFLGENVP